MRRISGIGGDRLIIRNRFTFDPNMEVNEGRVAKVGQDHDRSFMGRFPNLLMWMSPVLHTLQFI